MNICAVVVWFNPKELKNPVSNIMSFAIEVDRVYIVDNSSANNSELASKIQNSAYIPLLKNTGIANALNVGCEYAMKDGFEWCMTMDQDSSWNTNNLKRYMSEVKKNENNYQNFSPTLKFDYIYSFTGNLKTIFHKNKNKKFFDYQHEDRWITSGSVMNLSVWCRIGKFNHELFIDEVDFDYCARFSSEGMRNLCCKNIILNHQLGDSKKVLFINYGTHNEFRLYYQIRNLIYMKNKYPNYCYKYRKSYDLKKIILKEIFLGSGKKMNFFRLLKKAVADSNRMRTTSRE